MSRSWTRVILGMVLGAAYFAGLNVMWVAMEWTDRRGRPITLDHLWLLALIGGAVGGVVGWRYRNSEGFAWHGVVTVVVLLVGFWLLGRLLFGN